MEEKALEAGETDEAIINAIFRLFHSLKGSASFLDLQTIISVTHEAETLLDIFRNGQAAIDAGHVDLLIRTTDFIRNILDVVETQLNDEGYEDSATEIIADLKDAIANVAESRGKSEAEQKGAGAAEEETAGAAPQEQYTPSENCEEMGLEITPEILKRYVEESSELLDEAENTLLALERAPQDAESAERAYRAFHSIKGNSGFLGYPDLEEISRRAEDLLGTIRQHKNGCDPVAISFMLIAIDILRDGVRQAEAGARVELPGKQEVCAYLEKLTAEAAKAGPEKEPAEKAAVPAAKESRPAAAKESEKTIEAESDPKEKGAGAAAQQAIRVDLDKLDKLLDLVGELVISEAMVANNPDLKGLQLDRFEKAVLQLDKITRDIQEVAMSMRMIPLSGAFRKMMRLVRDLAHKAEKKVSLEIIGEETEVDKTIIEQISDPLVHLIRNAVDHGIESAEERLAAGKPETGRVTLEAKHSAGEVWIVVEDDGKGLDREKIIKKGIDRGLITSEDSEMKDEEVWRMIFEPGFSTADKVSNISGRGVGMDVVKRNIEKLRGKVDVRSRTGSGTMFVVRIPLTLAIIEGMVVKVGSNRYTIPINSIKESLQPKESQITRTPDGLEIVSIRGELLPVIRVHDLYQVATDCEVLTDGILIVVENDEKKCCLLVDEVIGQQQIVIKGLSSYLGHVQSISGCAILGDGDISMILDIDDLIVCAEQVKH
jgi:two-component system chemotaxis sensor kinase CheA